MPKNRTIRYALKVFLLLPLISFAYAQEIKEYKVIKGDTLWDITKAELNDPFLWSRVWKENPSIANPDKIYPDQIIKIPLYIIQEKKNQEEVALKHEEEVALKPTEEVPLNSAGKSQKSAIVADRHYKGIKGIVLQDGTAIEGQVIFMSAEIVKIRTIDGNISSYSFIKEVQSFIKE